MEQYDVVSLGRRRRAVFFARRITEAGHSVLVLDKLYKHALGQRLDIFHVGKPDFARFGIPLPEENDDFAFEFTGGLTFSAFGRYPKKNFGTTVGMHMPRYIARLNRWAKEAGAEFLLGASFVDFLYEDGRVSGVRYEKDGRRHEVNAKLVCDCSGIPSVARRKLPDGYGVENFEITDTEKFYVTLRYVTYRDPNDYIKNSRGWTYYKTWEAPEGDPECAILGVGANFSYDEGERYSPRSKKRFPCRVIRSTALSAAQPPTPPAVQLCCGRVPRFRRRACLTKPSAV